MGIFFLLWILQGRVSITSGRFKIPESFVSLMSSINKYKWSKCISPLLSTRIFIIPEAIFFKFFFLERLSLYIQQFQPSSFQSCIYGIMNSIQEVQEELVNFFRIFLKNHTQYNELCVYIAFNHLKTKDFHGYVDLKYFLNT